MSLASLLSFEICKTSEITSGKRLREGKITKMRLERFEGSLLIVCCRR